MRAIVLGSGLNKFTEYFEVIKSISFEDVLNVSFEILDGHDRKFVWCRFAGEEFLVISGKFHFYEGHSFEELIGPIQYAIEELGVDEIVVTSASGGLGEKIVNGDWTYIKQAVSIPEVNINLKLIGVALGKRSKTKIENAAFATLPKVTYAFHQGPSLGTNAEYKMLYYLGADLVGMSMYPEYCYLKTLQVVSHFISIPVCNYFPFESIEEPSFEEVLEVSNASIPKLVDIFKKLF